MRPSKATRELIEYSVRIQMLEQFKSLGLDNQPIHVVAHGDTYVVDLLDIDYRITLTLEYK